MTDARGEQHREGARERNSGECFARRRPRVRLFLSCCPDRLLFDATPRDAPVRQSVIKSGEGEEAERGGGRSRVGVGSDFAAAAVGADGDDGEGGAGNDCHSKK